MISMAASLELLTQFDTLQAEGNPIESVLSHTWKGHHLRSRSSRECITERRERWEDRSDLHSSLDPVMKQAALIIPETFEVSKE
jgi:hypothetical protein